MFHFSNLAEFAHHFEAVLDLLRNEKLSVTQELIDTMLSSLDCLREMIALLQQGEPGKPETTAELMSAFDNILEESNLGAEVESEEDLEALFDSLRAAGEEITAEVEKEEVSDKPALEKQKTKAAAGAASNASLRVATDKVDEIVNLVGELVITQSMIEQLGVELGLEQHTRLADGLSQLASNTKALQESVMSIRMLPIKSVFNRFPRLVRDLSRKFDKQIDFEMFGEETELDKTVLEQIGDPLVHLIRNALDHGIETADERVAAGKPPVGTLKLSAYQQSGNIMISIDDDGRGLSQNKLREKAISQGIISHDDKLSASQINNLIFAPGFSTAEVVTDVSGRGVGMDAVKKNIQALGGTIKIASEEGVGTNFTILLPLTLAILDGQLLRVGEEIYVMPLVSIVESIQIDPDKVEYLNVYQREVYQYRDSAVPIIRMSEFFDIDIGETPLEEQMLIIVETGNRLVALMANELLAQQQVVIKSLEEHYHAIEGISGATILGDGDVALILDVSSIGQTHEHDGEAVQQMVV